MENKKAWKHFCCEYCQKEIDRGMVVSFKVKYSDDLKEGLKLISREDKIADMPVHKECWEEICFMLGDPGLDEIKKKEFEARIISMARAYNKRKEGTNG